MFLLAMLLMQADAVFDAATGYRIAHYRGVVPSPPPGVTRIDDDAARMLKSRQRAVFIDVTPAAGASRDEATGTWRLAEDHSTIPGAHWFPESGRGDAGPAITDWFLTGVARLTRHDPKRTVVVFCLADCWMSWNASYRLTRAGYRDVRWYANGADGWRDAGRPLAPVVPER